MPQAPSLPGAKRDGSRQPMGAQDHRSRMPPNPLLILTTTQLCSCTKGIRMMCIVSKATPEHPTIVIRVVMGLLARIMVSQRNQGLSAQSREIRRAVGPAGADWRACLLARDLQRPPALCPSLYKYLPPQLPDSPLPPLHPTSSASSIPRAFILRSPRLNQQTLKLNPLNHLSQ